MYRPEWFDMTRSIAQIAVDVHSTVVGSLDRESSEQAEDVKALRFVVENWHEPSSNFDLIVKSLIRAALHEATQ